MDVLQTSSLYESEPLGMSEGTPLFLNAVVEGRTELDPQTLLAALKRLEKEAGREKDSHGKSRPLDLDILFYGDKILISPELEIPHPRLHERRFVLVPFCDVAPSWKHPVLRKTMRELLDACRDASEVKVVGRF